VFTVEQDGWEMRRIQMNSHDATHVNVQAHGVAGGKTLDKYPLECFRGPAKIYDGSIEPGAGVIFREQNIDTAIAEEIKRVRPLFVGLSADFEFDLEIEKDLLRADIISYERLTNVAELPSRFDFYGMPLPIREGDGSPIRAFAIITV
jgi:kynurenine formamidase